MCVHPCVLACSSIVIMKHFIACQIHHIIPLNQSALVTAFQQGQHADYFATWDQYIAPKAPHLYELQEMEFYLNIYFAIYTIHPHIRHKGGARVDLSKAMEAYKMFLETRGADLSKTEQFLPFYALPYVPDPRAHPSFKELFKVPRAVVL